MRTGEVPAPTAAARESITTKRLVLRPLQESDADAIYAYNDADPDVRRYALVKQVSREYARQFARWASGATRPAHKLPVAYYFAVCPQGTGETVGFCGFWITDGIARCNAQMGYELSSSFWGAGYMTEAVAAIVAYGFAQVGVRRIAANCFQANRASVRVLEKAGFQKVPVQMKDRFTFWLSWHFRPVVTYAITRDEWQLQAAKAVQ